MRLDFAPIVLLCASLSACGPHAAAPARDAASHNAASHNTASDTTASAASLPHEPPQKVGDCVNTVVTEVGSRLEGVPNSGSAILYANGLTQVSYDAVPGIDHSKPGDNVRLCLTSLPQNCPPGDDRGKVYSAANQRTGEIWSASDSEHMCGGA
jgi:hypothetical protein